MGIDKHKVQRWLNARKLTGIDVSNMDIDQLSEILNVNPSQLLEQEVDPLYVYQSSDVFISKKLEVERDGIHFYNYYPLAAPRGHVSPVVLDILCPANRIPELNQGHLEPAITINLGPGSIMGRWHEDTSRQDAYLIIEPESSYVEPSYCPHTYHLASQQEARIISFTIPSPLQNLIDLSNTWDDERFERMLKTDLCDSQFDKLAEYSWHFPLAPCWCDSLGKVHMSKEEVNSSTRSHKGYKVRSLAYSPSIEDMCGLIMQAQDQGEKMDYAANTFYFITSSEDLVFDCQEAKIQLSPEDSLWVGPHVEHCFQGHGAFVKLHEGGNYGSWDLYNLQNTFRSQETMRRARKDDRCWNG
jgi:2-hydroxyethylphosphonate dioxygenase